MKNTWFEISLGSLTSLFPDFPSMCLSCQEKLRQHFMSKMSNSEIPSQKPQKPRGTFRLPGRWNEISAFLLAAVSVLPWLCLVWWPLSWQRFLSQPAARSPPSCSPLKADVQGWLRYDALLRAASIPWLQWWDGMPPRKAGEEAQEDLKPKVWAELLGLKLCWCHSKWSVTQLKQTELGQCEAGMGEGLERLDLILYLSLLYRLFYGS